VLVLDGSFLHRDELFNDWDLSVLLDVPSTVSVAPHGRARRHKPGSHCEGDDELRRGQRLYLSACDPVAGANIVIDNSDWDQPVVRPSPVVDPLPGHGNGLWPFVAEEFRASLPDQLVGWDDEVEVREPRSEGGEEDL